MNIIIRKYTENDLESMIKIWNDVVNDGIAFPQDKPLSYDEGKEFFAEQSYCGVACDRENNNIAGLYILHPNNVGRCSHISNASYAVDKNLRNQHIGEKLVKDCIKMAKENGFKILQFNAVVKTNASARHLYEKLGFIQLGTIKDGFLMKNGIYEDICPYYITL